jgi:hypothetical protein
MYSCVIGISVLLLGMHQHERVFASYLPHQKQLVSIINTHIICLAPTVIASYTFICPISIHLAIDISTVFPGEWVHGQGNTHHKVHDKTFKVCILASAELARSHGSAWSTAS